MMENPYDAEATVRRLGGDTFTGTLDKTRASAREIKMTTDTLTLMLGWASVVNISILVFSTIGLITFRDFIPGVHSRLFGVGDKDLGRAYFQYLAQYKIAIIVFNISPYLALRIMA